MKIVFALVAVHLGIALINKTKPSATIGAAGATRKRLKDLVNTNNKDVCFSFRLPIKDIFVDTALFQNRETDYSESSTNRIVFAVETGAFEWAMFDPITVWLSDDKNKYFVLSGHSRRAAFLALSKRGFTDFETIPVKIFTGTNKQAVRLALNSNTLSTPEKETERAAYYRKRFLQGEPFKSLRDEIRLNEAANAPRILAYLFLNHNGDTMNALRLFEQGDVDSSENIRAVAKWIGDLRYLYLNDLSDQHENEIFGYLVKQGSYRKYKGIWILKKCLTC